MEDQVKKTTQTKIKKLKKEIEIFQLEVDQLLRSIPTSSTDSTCIICMKTQIECEDLPCQHVICKYCYTNQTKKNSFVKCTVCQQQYYVLRPIGSFSSDETDL